LHNLFIVVTIHNVHDEQSLAFSAIIEHTNQVIYLEDNDVAAVNRHGQLTIHRVKRSIDDPHASSVREVITLALEIQQIMKGMVTRWRSCRVAKAFVSFSI
jgi:glucosamine 6-phosphate synthetase-like amidotransferase/phosphosugar isomerase protein